MGNDKREAKAQDNKTGVSAELDDGTKVVHLARDSYERAKREDVEITIPGQ